MKLSVRRTSLLFFGLLLTGLLVFHIQDSSHLLMLLQMAVVLALLILYAGLLLFPGPITDRLRHALHVFIGACVGSWLLVLPIWRLQRHLTEKRASGLIQQIDAFRLQHGHYPQSLEQLVSAQSPAAAHTALGLWSTEPFGYYTVPVASKPDQSFTLSYSQEFLVKATYSSRTRQWHYDD